MSNARDFASRVPVDGALSNRNLIINGAMQVAQRGTSFAEAASEAYGVDRFKYQRSSTSGRVTLSQGDGLAGVSPKSVKIEVTTAAAATPPANVFHQYRYAIEGNDVDHLGLGTADCKELTLSFYAKASTTGTLPFALGNVGGTKTYPNTFDISIADTWQRYVYKIPAVTDGSWASGTASGLDLRIGFEYGSDYTGGTVGQWATTSAFANFAPTYTNPLASTLNATLQITGVQLEQGDSATPFEHRSYGDELARCQRYLYRLNGNSSDQTLIGAGYFYGATTTRHIVHYPVTMRGIASVSANGLEVLRDTGADASVTLGTPLDESIYSCGLNIGSVASTTVGEGCILRLSNSTSSYIQFDAEL